MIRILGNISGILCMIILLFNFLSYFLKDIYIKIDNLNLRKTINLILPIISKYNKPSILICFLLFSVHISCFFKNINFFRIDTIILSLLLISITFDFYIIPKYRYSYFKKIASYSIIFFIILHLFKFL